MYCAIVVKFFHYFSFFFPFEFEFSFYYLQIHSIFFSTNFMVYHSYIADCGVTFYIYTYLSTSWCTYEHIYRITLPCYSGYHQLCLLLATGRSCAIYTYVSYVRMCMYSRYDLSLPIHTRYYMLISIFKTFTNYYLRK